MCSVPPGGSVKLPSSIDSRRIARMCLFSAPIGSIPTIGPRQRWRFARTPQHSCRKPRAARSFKRHPELTPWRHEELTPLPGCRIPEAVLAERSSTESIGGTRVGSERTHCAASDGAGVPVDPRGRAAVRVWQPTVSPAQSRAAARCWPIRRDRDRRWPATPRRWWCRATAQAARRARRHIWPAAR